MQKYTKKDVLEKRISFKPMTKEQHAKLVKHFGYGSNYESNCYYRFYPAEYGLSPGESFGKWPSSYLNDNSLILSSEEILFEEFDFEDEFVLSEKWCIQYTPENKNILEKWKRLEE